jgi:hypothetical protein
MDAGDAVLLAAKEGETPQQEGRGTWMTELPPERRPQQGPPSQVSVTAFSQKEKRSRGETHAWTDTPEQARAREAQKMLAGYSVRVSHHTPRCLARHALGSAWMPGSAWRFPGCRPPRQLH